MNSSYDNKSENDFYYVNKEVPDFVYIASCVYMAIIFLIGFVANTSILILFISSPLIRTPFNYLLMNLIIAESLITMYGLPVDFMATYHFGWKMGEKLCKATGFILTTSGEVSIVTLAVLSVQRLLSIAKRKKYTNIPSFMIIGCIWIYSLCISLPPFYGFGAFSVETSGMTCAPDWESNEHVAYTWYWLILGFLLPLVVIVYSSVKTVICLKKISNSSNSDPIKRMSKRRDTKVSVLVLWMNIAFFTCWMPYGIVALCYIFGGEGFVNPLIVVIPLLASKSSVCWNPMLYIVMNFQFRGAFHRLINLRKEKALERHKWTRVRKKGGSPKTEIRGRNREKQEVHFTRRQSRSTQNVTAKNTSFAISPSAISDNNNETKNAFNNLRFTTLAAVIKKSSSNNPSDTTVDIHGNSLDVHNKMSGKIVSQVIERHSFLENGSQLPKSKKVLDIICDAENVPNQNEGLLQCQNAQLMDHIYSQNKLIDALNLRKTSVYV